jgi:RNA polymerase II subunit A small phosphatase-like protein
VSPDPGVANNDADDDASEPRPSLALKEMTSVRPVDHDMDPCGLDSAVDTDATASPTLTVPPVTIQIELPPSSSDPEVIVPPPSSTHLLPEDETDGVTSGAVQPPGSTGDHMVRTNTHDTEDSDGTSYTDDEGEDRRMQDEQDEEERLIRSGGSGIPIGPVRPPTLLPC